MKTNLSINLIALIAVGLVGCSSSPPPTYGVYAALNGYNLYVTDNRYSLQNPPPGQDVLIFLNEYGQPLRFNKKTGCGEFSALFHISISNADSASCGSWFFKREKGSGSGGTEHAGFCRPNPPNEICGWPMAAGKPRIVYEVSVNCELTKLEFHYSSGRTDVYKFKKGRKLQSDACRN